MATAPLLLVLLVLCSDEALGSSSRIAPTWHRPLYHFSAPRGWMNDPIAPVFVDGTAHLFYQANPTGLTWGNISWGHATSKDLLYWQDEPLAITPSMVEKSRGIFTGSVFAHDGDVYAAFTSATQLPVSWNLPYTPGEETQVIARARSHKLTQWDVLGDPVIPKPPDQLCVTGFRDPSVFPAEQCGDGGEPCLRMLLSGGLRGQDSGKCSATDYKGGALFLYEAYSGTDFQFKSVVLTSSGGWLGNNWECGNFLSAVTSTEHNHYFVVGAQPQPGRWNRTTVWMATKGSLNGTLHPTTGGTLDYGNLYAVAGFADESVSPAGQVVMGWSDEDLPAGLVTGFAGVLSLPRTVMEVVGSEEGGQAVLGSQPWAQAETLRLVSGRFESLEPSGAAVTAGVTADNTYDLEFAVVLDKSFPRDAKTDVASCSVLRSEKGNGHLTLTVSVTVPAGEGGQPMVHVHVDRTHASFFCGQANAAHHCDSIDVEVADTQLAVGQGSLNVRVLVDRSIVEVFVGSAIAITTRAYPSSDGVGAVVKALAQKTAPVSHVRAWRMQHVWTEPRASSHVKALAAGGVAGVVLLAAAVAIAFIGLGRSKRGGYATDAEYSPLLTIGGDDDHSTAATPRRRTGNHDGDGDEDLDDDFDDHDDDDMFVPSGGDHTELEELSVQQRS